MHRFVDEFFELSLDLLCVADLNGYFIRLNPAWEETFGYTIQELTSKPFIEFVHPDDRDATRLESAKLAAGLPTIKFANRYQHKDGSYHWVLWNVRLSKKQNVLIAVARDITREREDEAALVAKNIELDKVKNKLERVMQLAPIGIYTTDLHGKCDFVNKSWSGMTGLSFEEALGDGWHVALAKEDRKAVSAAWLGLVQENKMFVLEYRFRKPNGEETSVSGRAVAQFNENGVVTGYLGVVQDVTEARLAQRESEFYKLALDSADTVTFTDADGRIIYANDLFCQVSGYTRDEMMGQDHRLFKSGLMPRGFFEGMWKQITSGKIWKGEICNRKKDGSLFWVDSVIVPCLDSHSKPIQYIAIRRDITAKKLQQTELQREKLRAERATEAKSQFLANMSHEIRTPLNGVLGLANLMSTTALSQEQAQYVAGLKTSGEQLLTLINDILDFSKIEAGKLALESVECDLLEIVDDTLKMLDPPAKAKGLTLKFRGDRKGPWSYTGDSARLRQVVSNLVGNAIKFTEAGGVTVNIQSQKQIDSISIVRVSVSDTGIGMTDKEMARLFQPFTQADLSTTRRFGGTGLGLSICKRIVELMNGVIGVDSKDGVGSTFWFEVPLKISECKNKTPTVASFPTIPVRALHILVVEDNQLNQLVAVRNLEKMGHRASTAGNGKEALQILKEISFDLVFMDCQMPVMDGYETTAYIRSHHELGGDQIPIVAMTANAVAGEEEKCLAAGMNAFITKPVRVEQLHSVISQYCGEVSTIAKKAA